MGRTHLRIRRLRGGGFALRLPREERDVLRSLPAQLRALIDDDDASVARLFPPAHPDDPTGEAEYRGLVGDELVAGRRRALEIVEGTVDADRLDDEQLAAWLSVLNDARLVLGTQLDVTEDLDPDRVPDEGPDAYRFALYFYLGWLQEQIVEALASGIPEPAEGERG